MTTTIPLSDAPTVDANEMVSRFDPARLLPRKDLKGVHKIWEWNIRRADLTETQMALAWLIGQDTLRAGYLFVIYDSLDDLVQERSHVMPLWNLDRAKVHAALRGVSANVSGRRADGLEGMGLIRLEHKFIEGKKRWLVSVLTDASQWRVSWRWAADRLPQRQLVLDDDRRRFAAYFPSLAPELDLHDAMSAVAAANCIPDAPMVDGKAAREVSRAAFSSTSMSDAPDVRSERNARTSSSPVLKPRCQISNAKSLDNTGNSPPRCQISNGNSLTVKQKPLTETVQQLNCLKDDSNRLLQEMRVQFTRAHGAKAAEQEMSQSGGAWRLIAQRWPDVFEQQVAGLRDFLSTGGKIKWTAWSYLQYYIKQALDLPDWATVCKKSKESL